MINNIDKTVLKETKYIALSVAAMGAAEQLVFAAFGAWDLSVLLGFLLIGAFSVLNFLLMGITVQQAVGLESKQIASKVRLSQGLRLIMLGGAIVLGVSLSCFNTIVVVVTVFFPRIAIFARTAFIKKSLDGDKSEGDDSIG